MGAVLHMAIIIHGAPCLVSPRSERREGKMKKRKEGAVRQEVTFLPRLLSNKTEEDEAVGAGSARSGVC